MRCVADDSHPRCGDIARRAVHRTLAADKEKSVLFYGMASEGTLEP
jgi:hypothetical protein